MEAIELLLSCSKCKEYEKKLAALECKVKRAEDELLRLRNLSDQLWQVSAERRTILIARKAEKTATPEELTELERLQALARLVINGWAPVRGYEDGYPSEFWTTS